MDVLAKIQAGGRTIDCGVATTKAERAAILAQRFRVYEHRGYHRPGLNADHDAHDRRAAHFLAVLGPGDLAGLLLGSARLIRGEPHASFCFPVEEVFQLELPAAVRAIPVPRRAEVSRLVAESTQGIVIGGLLTPLGLIKTITAYSRQHGIQLGFSIMKSRFLRLLHAAGLPFHEISPAQLAYPRDGAMAGYFYRDLDPVVPVYWLAEEIAPSVERALLR